MQNNMNNYQVYVNGKFVFEEDAKISFNDAGFMYGDGIFETIRFDNKKMFSPKQHIKRLRSGLKSMSINLTNDDLFLINLLNKMIKINPLNNGLLRLMITR